MANDERDREVQRIPAHRNAELVRALAGFASDADLRRMLTELAELYEAEAAGAASCTNPSDIKES